MARHAGQKVEWSGGGSNSQPRHCERRALPVELPPHRMGNSRGNSARILIVWHTAGAVQPPENRAHSPGCRGATIGRGPLPPHRRITRLPYARSPDRRPRCPRAQPSRCDGRPAARPARLLDRRERLGQVEPRLRHALCRGAAALRREPLHIRPAVPRPVAAAGCRQRDGPLPFDLDRAEVGWPQSPVDRRHDDGDPRFSPRPLCADRHGPLSGVRQRLGGPAPRPDRGADHRGPQGPAGDDPRAVGPRGKG